jgi:hypothetical protein
MAALSDPFSDFPKGAGVLDMIEHGFFNNQKIGL